MDQQVFYGGKYDDLLTSHARAVWEAGELPSKTRLTHALRGETGVTAVEAGRAVDDFCERGALQALFGPGPYDGWLTAELEAARQRNLGLNGNSLAKKLQQMHPDFQGDTDRNRLLGLADAMDIVDDYFARYGLPSVLGPYPLVGIAIVVLTEAVLVLPVSWAAHFAFGTFLLGRPFNGPLFAYLYLVFVLGSIWKNWQKLRSAERWSRYDAARDRLPLRPPS